MANGKVITRLELQEGNYNTGLAKAGRSLEQFKKQNLSLNGIISGGTSQMLKMASAYMGVGAAISVAGKAIGDNISIAVNFEKSMSQLSSLTGMVGDDLNKLKGYAIELGSTTTLTASQVADAFKLIGSQQPQLLQSGEALKEVTKNAITLSEAAGIELTTAAQTLSTSINQMGGDSNNASRYINVLAAASQKGAGDIAWLGEAITKSATAAKAVGTDYEELVANLEQLAKAGFDAATAGTALRSIIMNLEKQANTEFKPSVVGLTQAFQNLADAHLTITEYQQLTGKLFASQAMALANAAGEAKNMTTAITGTNIAEEQAKTNTDNLDGSLKSLASAWEGLNLHINSSNGLLRDMVDALKDVVKWTDRYLTDEGQKQGFSDELANGGRRIFGKYVSGTQQNISRLRGSNHKNVVDAEIRKMYQDAIAAGERYVEKNKMPEHKEYLQRLKDAYEDYKKKADEVLGRTKKTVEADASNAAKNKIDKQNVTTLNAIDDRIKKLKEERAEMDINSKEFKDYTNEINKLETQKSKLTNKPTKATKTTKEDINAPDGSVKKLTQEMQELKKQQELSLSTKQWVEYQTQIDAVSDRIAILKGELPKDKEAEFTFTADISDVAKKLEDVDGVVVDPKTMTITANTQEAMQKVEEATRDIEGREVTLHVKSTIDLDKLFPDMEVESTMPDMTALEAAKQSMREKLASDQTFVDENSFSNLLNVAVQHGIDSLDPDFTSIQEQMREGMDIPDTAFEALQNKINEQLEEMEIEPIEIDFQTGDLVKVKNTAKAIDDGFADAARSVGRLGSVMSNIENPAAKVFGIVAEAIATVAQSFAASLKGTVSPWDWIAAATAGTATMISTIAAIKSSTAGTYADGGFITGGAGVGDAVPILANQGEYVMNQNELGYVAGMIDSLRTQTGEGSEGAETRVESDQIVLTIRNGARRRGLTVGEYLKL